MGRHAVVLCADDYGMSAGVSRGILDLAEAGRISATSVMANMPAWPRAAGDLRRLDGRIGIGLHVTLTWGAPLGPMPTLAPDGRFPGLGRLMAVAASGRLPVDEVADEIARQEGVFVRAFGRRPDFVDGHQHVHVLPVVRRALLAIIRHRSAPQRPLWLRDPGDRVDRILRRRIAVGKALAVAGLATGIRRPAEALGLSTNRGFAGFADFAAGADLGAAFSEFLSAPGPAHLVMCHPGLVGLDGTAPDDEGLDAVVASRRAELDYLSSPEFGALLARRSVTLVARPPAS